MWAFQEMMRKSHRCSERRDLPRMNVFDFPVTYSRHRGTLPRCCAPFLVLSRTLAHGFTLRDPTGYASTQRHEQTRSRAESWE